MKQGMQTMGKIDQPQGYGAQGPPGYKPAQKEEIKTMAMAGTGIINGQIPTGTQSKPYYAGAGATMGANVGSTAIGQYEASRATIPANHLAGPSGAGIAGNTALGMSAQKGGD